MKIKLHEIPISEVVEGFVDNDEYGVVGYGGRLNIRPAYQREFIYDEKQRNAVIDTVKKGFPLNVMYWVRNEDGTFELLDGQQRTLSICQFVSENYSVNYQYFRGLTQAEQKQILDYPLMIYICEGTDKEQLDWFRIINIAGLELTQQELRNAIYTGGWLTDAKRYFSKHGCAAQKMAGRLLRGVANRQDYLETAIRWLAAREGKIIDEYMAEHQHDVNANTLWLYFRGVIDWVNVLFPVYRKEMKGIEWGLLYNKCSGNPYDANILEQQTKTLMMDDDVTSKKGIYTYVLTGEEKHLSIRTFTEAQKRAAYERQKGICPMCGKHFEIEEMQGDHITPWSKGGKTVSENCKMLCADCNRRKSDV